jgi:glycogen synthase
MIGSVKEADILHCHSWYTHFAGCLLKEILAVPLVLTIHSLEPHRPWKEEQLGSGYRASTWLEKTALHNADGIIAVSSATKKDVCALYGLPEETVRVIHNGIDLNQYSPFFNPQVLTSYGIDPRRPYILFVGRITRQKGVIHFLNALPYLESNAQVVLCAGAPDTHVIAQEINDRVEAVRRETKNEIIWISEFVAREKIVVLYSHASLFVCPSVYEPFGLINIEAMACNTPVVASAVGGIPDAVIQGETGLLVDFEPVSRHDCEPKDPKGFSRDLAAAIDRLLGSPERLETMGLASRKRVERHFSWETIAKQTLAFYQDLVRAHHEGRRK